MRHRAVDERRGDDAEETARLAWIDAVCDQIDPEQQLRKFDHPKERRKRDGEPREPDAGVSRLPSTPMAQSTP